MRTNAVPRCREVAAYRRVGFATLLVLAGSPGSAAAHGILLDPLPKAGKPDATVVSPPQQGRRRPIRKRPSGRPSAAGLRRQG